MGAIITIAGFGIIVALIVVAVIILVPMISGAPYVRTDKRVIEIMMKLSRIQPGERVIDLGSGDGVLLISAAQLGAHATGYEINPLLVASSRKRFSKLGLDIQIYKKSLWKADVSQADVILLFGIMHIMPSLEKKLRAELKPGARVVSQTFSFPNWKPSTIENEVYLYVQN